MRHLRRAAQGERGGNDFIRIDIGDADPFYSATQSFIAQLPSPPAGGTSPGGHDGAFWSSQLPAEINWMVPYLTA